VYNPGIDAPNEATLPGFDVVGGTAHEYEYNPGGLAVAVSVTLGTVLDIPLEGDGKIVVVDGLGLTVKTTEVFTTCEQPKGLPDTEIV
jgi:hypothetical protein